MEFKGSKGKWDVSENKLNKDALSVKCGNVYVCRLFNADFNEDIEIDHNALLISKAPEMLSMLIKMKSAMLEFMDCADGWDDDYEELCTLIKEATTLPND